MAILLNLVKSCKHDENEDTMNTRTYVEYNEYSDYIYNSDDEYLLRLL